MNPVFFGTSREPLFGVYHPPQTASTVTQGVILCAPVGVEYMRTHRALQKLGVQLAKAGVHVFRFDYFGTGDSAGGGEAGTPERWADDVVAAAEELRDTARITAVSLVGLRIGAVLASMAAPRIGDVDRLVLWDPVTSAEEYAMEMLAHATASADNTGTIGAQGFPFSREAVEQLRRLDIHRALVPGVGRKVLMVVSTPDERYAAVLAGARERGLQMDMTHIPSAGDWDDMDRLGAALLPTQLIRGIVSWISGGNAT